MEWKAIDMLSISTLSRKTNNANYKGYVNKTLNEEMNSRDMRHVEAILDSFKFKKLKNVKTEETLKS